MDNEQCFFFNSALNSFWTITPCFVKTAFVQNTIGSCQRASGVRAHAFRSEIVLTKLLLWGWMDVLDTVGVSSQAVTWTVMLCQRIQESQNVHTPNR